MLRRNKEAWGMDVTQRKFYKYKKEKKKVWVHKKRMSIMKKD
jgi:hypothetical protein